MPPSAKSRTVAVEVMRPGLASPSLLRRFEYEAEVLGRAPVPYFVMEHIANARALTKSAAS